jgi:Tol biopolymer transport system component
VPDPASDASTGPTNVYVRDTCAGAAASCAPATTLISVAADGSAADGSSRAPSISADGRYVSFVSTADNLIAGGSSGAGEIFVRDTCAGAPAGCVPATTLVSLATDGSFANGPSDSPYLSANGRYVVFESSATNLVPNAKSSSPAIYMRDLCTGGPAGCQASTVLLSVSGASASSP